MLKLQTQLTEKEYISLIRDYILGQRSYKVILFFLSLIILGFSLLTIITKNYTNIKILGFWWVMGISYAFLIPMIISSRAKKIYQNTALLHKQMSFEFTEEGLTWRTIDGHKTFSYPNISIFNKKHGLILACSVYHILVIPNKDITDEIFDHLSTLSYPFKKHTLNKKLYNKYRGSL
ncbi:MAG: hypothetical protein ACRCV0_01150 [Brevinema sp.]